MCRRYSRVLLFPLMILCLHVGSANSAESSRRAPPVGIAVPAEVRAELEESVAEFGEEIGDLRKGLKDKPRLEALLPDVEIFHKAVQWPLLYSEFYRTNEFAMAR